MTEAATTPETAPAAAPEQTLDEVVAQVFGPQTPAPETSTAEASPGEQQPAEAAPAAEDPKVERIGARVAAAKRAEAKAAAERREITALREQQERRQAELDARESRIKLIEDDPVRFFEEFKSDPKAFLEKLAGEHKPENVVLKKQTALEAELAELKKQLADRETAAQKQAAKMQSDVAWQEASTAFVAHVGEHAAKFPHLVDEYTEAQATELAYQVLSEVVAHDAQGRPMTRAQQYHAEFGEYPDNDVVAEYLDQIAKARVEARQKSAWRKQVPAAPASQAATGDPKPAPQVNGAKPRTLTSREASQRASAPKPWTQEQADEESLRIIEASFRKGTG